MRHEHTFLRGLGAVLFAGALLIAAAACGDSSTSTVDAGQIDGSTDASTEVLCGGAAGQTCGADEFCAYPDQRCGNGVAGTCQPRPSACPFILDPVCACDGNTYDNACEASVEGHDVSSAGDCTPPVGAFACGDTFCMEGVAYCERQASDLIGSADSYECKPIPAACGGTPSCECLAEETCGTTCTEDGGGFTLTCLGG